MLAPALGGSVGNAVIQLARGLGAKHAISSTTNHTKAERAKALGFDEVIDLSGETLSDGVRRTLPGRLLLGKPLLSNVDNVGRGRDGCRSYELANHRLGTPLARRSRIQRVASIIVQPSAAVCCCQPYRRRQVRRFNSRPTCVQLSPQERLFWLSACSKSLKSIERSGTSTAF